MILRSLTLTPGGQKSQVKPLRLREIKVSRMRCSPLNLRPGAFFKAFCWWFLEQIQTGVPSKVLNELNRLKTFGVLFVNFKLGFGRWDHNQLQISLVELSLILLRYRVTVVITVVSTVSEHTTALAPNWLQLFCVTCDSGVNNSCFLYKPSALNKVQSEDVTSVGCTEPSIFN